MSKKNSKKAKRDRLHKIVFAALCAVLAVGCGVCAWLFRNNISAIPFLAGAVLALLGLINALWRVIYRAILPILALLCLAAGIAGQMSYVTVDGHTYSTFARSLDLSGDGVTNLSGIERCRFLTQLDIHGLGLEDVSPLTGMSGLETVRMRGNPISEAQYKNLTAALPQADISWSVPVGQSRVDDDAESLVLTEKEYVTNETLVRQLGYLQNLTYVDATALTNLSEEDLTLIERELPGARVVWTAPAGDGFYRTDSRELAITGAESGEALLSQLRWFFDLSSLDISECDLPRADVQAVVEGLGDVEVSWKFDFLQVPVTSEDTRLDMFGVALEDTLELRAVLDLATALNSVNLTRTGLSNEDLFSLVDSYPDIAFEYVISLFGVEVNSSETYLDLTEAAVNDALTLDEGLNYLPALQKVELGLCKIPSATLGAIQNEHANLDIVWTINLYGFTFRTDATHISFANSRIGELTALDEALGYMPNVKSIDLCGSGQPDASIAKLKDAHPGIRVVWTVNLGRWSLRTDATAFSTLDNAYNKYKATSANFEPLKYCTELRALDLGHQAITDLSFLSGLTELRILILADNRISDISPIGNLTKLEYVELFMNSITDVTPLANCQNLLDLNLCYNSVKNVNPIATLPRLERLWMSGNKLSATVQSFLRNALPGCKCDFTTDGSTDDGWREHKRYDTLFDIFNNTKEYREWDK